MEEKKTGEKSEKEKGRTTTRRELEERKRQKWLQWEKGKLENEKEEKEDLRKNLEA